MGQKHFTKCGTGVQGECLHKHGTAVSLENRPLQCTSLQKDNKACAHNAKKQERNCEIPCKQWSELNEEYHRPKLKYD